MNNMILSNLKKILDKTFLNIFPKLYLGLTRAQDSNDRFIFGHDIIKDKLKSNNINVLDAGCGGGNFYYYLKSRFSKFEYLGLEFDNQKIKSETYKKDNFNIIVDKYHDIGLIILKRMSRFLCRHVRQSNEALADFIEPI